MRLTRSTLARTTLAGAAVAVLLLGYGTPAAAKPDGATVAAAMAGQLGAHSAGSYLDASGSLVVTVTDAATAAEVRRAGAVARVVNRSGAQLAATMAELDRTAAVTGTALAVDPVSNQVVVSVDDSVTGADLARVRRAVARAGSAARLEHVAGVLSMHASGGDAIYGGQYRCSLGFNVRSGSGTYYFLTAGHCGNIASTWYSNASHTSQLGVTAGSSFPGNDYAIVRYTTSGTPPGTVGSQDITSAGTPVVGQTVTRRGSTTGIHSGRVTALNATVRYREGTVRGLIQTTVCAEGGDSGGPLYSRTTAYGLTSGGSGNCTFGGTTYFQPVTEALNVYGVSVY